MSTAHSLPPFAADASRRSTSRRTASRAALTLCLACGFFHLEAAKILARRSAR
jgi:hypothetical protein